MISTQVLQAQDESSEVKVTTFAPGKRIRNEDHRNWIRCNLGIQEIADATRPHVYELFRNYWNTEFWWFCHNRCLRSDCERNIFAHCHCESSEHACTYWYDHNHPENLQSPIKRRGDNWYIYTKKDCKGCNDQFAKVLSLFLDPKSPKICWKNVQFPIRDKGPWEIAKAFMPQGNSLVDTPDQAEGIALLNVINTCKLFDKDEDDKDEDDKHEDDKDEDDKHKDDKDEDDKHEDEKHEDNKHEANKQQGFDHSAVDKLISTRNKLTHSASHELSTKETDDIFDMMVAFLKNLKSIYHCHTQLENLEKLREKELTADLIDRAFAKSVQALMNEISDRLAAGENASFLMERLKSTIEVQKQHSVSAECEVEVKKFKKDLEKENKRLTEDLKSKDDKIEKLETDLKKLQEENKEKNIELKDQEKNMVVKNDTIQDLKARLHDVQEEIKMISQQLEEQQKENLKKGETITNLMSSLNKLKAESDKMQQDHKKEMVLKEETIERLKQDLCDLKEENERAKLQIQNLDKKLHDLQEEKEKIKLQFEEHQKEILMKMETIQNLQRSLHELQLKSENMQQEHQKEMLLKEETIERLKMDLCVLKEENKGMRLTLEEQKKEMINKIETITNLETDLNELKKENDDLRLQLQGKDQEIIKRLEKELLELQKENEKIRYQLHEKEEQNFRLKVENEEKIAEINRLRAILDDQVHEIRCLTDERDNLKKTESIINDLNTVVASKEEEIKISLEEINRLNISNDERADEIRSVSDTLVMSNIVTVIITVFFMRVVMIFY